MTEHLELVSERVRQQTHLRDVLAAVIGQLDGGTPTDVSADLLRIMQDIVPLQPEIERNVSILIYSDLQAAYDYLTGVYRLAPGLVTKNTDGNVQHAVVQAGPAEVWLHPESRAFALSSPRRLRASTATTAVLVDDVDEHHRHSVAAGADIKYSPVDQPYGFREYSAVDLEGHLWSFMRPLE